MKHRRSIRAVYRVQCGKCDGWLGAVKEVVPVGESWTFPGEGSARRMARMKHWTQGSSPGVLLCPACSANPLGIVLPEWPEAVCVCTHPRHTHPGGGICKAVPGVLGCGCFGWKKK